MTTREEALKYGLSFPKAQHSQYNPFAVYDVIKKNSTHLLTVLIICAIT